MSTSARRRANLVPKPLLLLLFLGVIVGVSTVVAGAIENPAAPSDADQLDLRVTGGDSARNETSTAPPHVVQAGDVNGDGTDDLLLGAPDADVTGDNAGVVGIVFGPADPETVTLADADATVTGEAAGDRAGTAVSGDRDLDGDGIADVVIGAPSADPAGTDSGAVYVVYGGESVTGERSLDAADVRVAGEPGDHAGMAVATAGDAVNGGTAVIVGAPQAGKSNAGAAVLVSTETLAGVDNGSLAPLADARLAGGSAGGQLGWAVANAGDVDGDNTSDVLVGAPNASVAVANGTQAEAGAAYLLSGPVSGDQSVENATVLLRGEAAGDRAGYTVAGAGDQNGDGIDDLVVGAPSRNATANGTAAGAAYLVYGANGIEGDRGLGTANETLVGESGSDNVGWSIAHRIGSTPCASLAVGQSGDASNATAGVVYVHAANTSASVRAGETGTACPQDGAAASASRPAANDSAMAEVSGQAAGGGSSASASSGGGDDGASTDTSAAAGESRGAGDTGGNDQTAEQTPGAQSIETTIVCSDDKPYLYNPNGFGVTVTVSGPDGTTTYDVGPGMDVGGPSPPSFQSPNTAPGEYTASATGPDGDPVPVNSQSAYTTTVKRCPTSQLTTTCVDGDTVRVDLAVDNLTGRHDVPVSVAVASPNSTDRQTMTLDPSDGAASTAFDVSDSARASVVAKLESTDGPSRLEQVTIDAGTCDDSATSNATDGEQSTQTGTATPDNSTDAGDDSAPAQPVEALDATIVCADDKPYFYNPNGFPVDVTVAGPDGVDDVAVGPGMDVGGPSPPSFQTPNMQPGEYTVTAEGPNGRTIPVNGEVAYTTTVKECPTSTIQTVCVDGDTTEVSFAAERLTGRHAVPVSVKVMSPVAEDRQTITREPTGGSVATTFEVSDAARATVVARLQTTAGPDRLGSLTIPAGACDAQADSTATPTDAATSTQTAAAAGESSSPTETAAATTESTPAQTATATPSQPTATTAQSQPTTQAESTPQDDAAAGNGTTT